MPKDIKSITLSKFMTNLEKWVITLTPENKQYIFGLIEEYKKGNLSKADLFYNLADTGPNAQYDDEITEVKFDVKIE